MIYQQAEQRTVARIDIAYRGIKSFFSTTNDKEYPERMRIHLKEGPFTRMEGHWSFTPLGQTACKIEFHLHYEFSNHILSKMMGPVFNQIAESMVESFVSRAGVLYA